MISVRPMTAADIDAVLALEQGIPEAPHWNRAAYEGCIVPNDLAPGAGFVAETDGNLVGFAVAKLVAGICELESIAVAKEARRQGTGEALFTRLLSWAELHGAIRMELEVRASNAAAIRLYEKFAFTHEGIRTNYYANPADDALLLGRVVLSSGKLP